MFHWLALNAVSGLGPVKIQQLLSYYHTPEAVFNASHGELEKTGILSATSLQAIKSEKTFSFAESEIKRAESKNIKIIPFDDPQYPVLLREIFAPPPLLYVKGDSSLLSTRSIGIVGMRSPDIYGKDAATHICSGLLQNGITITSGLALGIDTVAHQTSVGANNPTIAVLGSGVDILYPKPNRELYETIIEKGAIVSEFPIGTPPVAYNFPRRNRIISGLSLAVVVIQAGLKSGSLITAQYALAQNRDIFAVPGSIFSPLSLGTFNLIREGAIPILSGNDVIKNLGPIQHVQESAQKTIDLPPLSLPQKISTPLSETEQKLVETLSISKGQDLDTIKEAMGTSLETLFPLLLNLELKGIITQVAGQLYIRTP